MKNFIPLFTFILLLFTSGCDHDSEETQEAVTNSPTINGYYVRDNTGEEILAIGSPNIKTGDSSNPDNYLR